VTSRELLVLSLPRVLLETYMHSPIPFDRLGFIISPRSSWGPFHATLLHNMGKGLLESVEALKQLTCGFLKP
jgi:hypothetical protein